MSSETEMRRVLVHAADKLTAAGDADMNGYEAKLAARLAMTYAEAVLRMLASYLTVTEPDDDRP